MKILLPITQILIVCAVALAGAWLWMTPYRYGTWGGDTIRVHRINGRTEVLTLDYGWIDPVRVTKIREWEALPPEEKKRADKAFMRSIFSGLFKGCPQLHKEWNEQLERALSKEGAPSKSGNELVVPAPSSPAG